MSVRALVLGLLLLAVAAGASIAESSAPTLGGKVQHALQLDEALLRSLPQTSLDITFETGKGPVSGHYTGVLVWTLLQQAMPIDEVGKNASLRHTLIVTGRDGYQAAIAFGELDPLYEGKQAIVAYDGGAPPASFANLRLVVPGDKHGGRSVRDIASIEVR